MSNQGRSSSADSSVLLREKVRVKTGCITCRVRRVKCDEGKPACLRCRDSGRECDGYAPTDVSRRRMLLALRTATPIARVHSPSADAGFQSERERRDFDVFRSRAGQQGNNIFSAEFWDRLVLQISETEPSVRHGVFALSALLQRFDESAAAPEEASETTRREYALLQYGKAVGHAQGLLSRANENDIPTVLVACIIFVCYENLAGNYASAQMHLHNGLHILTRHSSRFGRYQGRFSSTSASVESIVDLLDRLDVEAWTFSDELAPYPYHPTDPASSEPAPLPTTFSSLIQAQHALFERIKRVFWLDRNPQRAPNPSHPEDLAAGIARSIGHLDAWMSRFEVFLAAYPGRCHPRSTLLKMYCTMVRLMGVTALEGSESSWDAYTSDFQAILRQAESIILPRTGRATAPYLLFPNSESTAAGAGIFSFEMGVIPPLFMTARKCRDPLMRRRAIALLHAAPRKEGIWDGLAAARLAEKIVEIEETGLTAGQARGGPREAESVTEAQDLPDEARLSGFSATHNVEGRNLKVQYASGDGGGADEEEDGNMTT